MQMITEIYESVKRLIDRLERHGHASLAGVLRHRLYDVPWTSGEELLEELQVVLSRAESSNDFPEPIAIPIQQIQSDIKAFLEARN